jgi:hypothetical protein
MNSRVFLAPVLLVLAMAAGCDRRESAWQDAREADTVAAYQSFIEDYPDSPQSEQARQRMRELQRAEQWERARGADSAEAYQQFVADFPEAPEAERARARFEELERERAWEDLRQSGDILALRDFAERHRGEPVADQARQRIEELEAQAREAEQARREAEEERRRAEEATRTHRVQLAAFRSEERANQGVQLLEQRLARLLGETRLEVDRSGEFYLLRTQPLSEDDARALCSRLQENDQECLVTGRGAWAPPGKDARGGAGGTYSLTLPAWSRRKCPPRGCSFCVDQDERAETWPTARRSICYFCTGPPAGKRFAVMLR